MMHVLWLVAFLALGLALGGSLAHLYELPHKIRLPSDEYLTVQQIYRGWNRLGFAIGGALVSAIVLALLLRRSSSFGWILATVMLIVGTQVIFWTWTYPTNTATQNWTFLPENWVRLRAQWEYSHAAGAVLNLAALCTLVMAALRHQSS